MSCSLETLDFTVSYLTEINGRLNLRSQMPQRFSVLITFSEEVMLLPQSFCWMFHLSVSRMMQKLLNEFPQTLVEGGTWTKISEFYRLHWE